MSSDIEFEGNEDFDEVYSDFDHGPFPLVCPNEVVGIESLSSCFFERYNACPALFFGSLYDACKAGFGYTQAKEHRPVLVYVHHDRSIFGDTFCSNIFCSEIIVEYLLENYIVWVWDITLESNKNRFQEIWQEMFPTAIYDAFSVERCPALIGIMRTTDTEKCWSSIDEYELQSLLTDDTRIHSAEQEARITVLQELTDFKVKCDKNEQALCYNFHVQTGLPWKTILEIAKYLSINDAISAFSENILTRLQEDGTKVHITKPSFAFINMILRKINPNQIASLQFNEMNLWTPDILSSLNALTNVISLTLVNHQSKDGIKKSMEPFRALKRLSLSYDMEVDFNILYDVIEELPESIRRFEIHGAGEYVGYYNPFSSDYRRLKSWTVQYLVIDIGRVPLASGPSYFLNNEQCFLKTINNLINHMPNTRNVHLVINKNNVAQFFSADEWRNLQRLGRPPKKIIMEVLKNMISGEYVIEQRKNIRSFLEIKQ